MLCLEHVSWAAPDSREVLRDVSLTIPDGRLVVITGPNGSGKTTLARILVGIEKPTGGRIFLDGEDITDLSVSERAKKGISFAFQQPVRFKGITVKQLIEIAAGTPVSEGRLCGYLGDVGLCAREYLDREVDATLSGGEMKRIEIATVLARKSRLAVFDEPEAGIDLWSFKNLIGVFQRMKENRTGIQILISHQERILRIADEILLLTDGTVRAQGAGDPLISEVLGSGGGVAACCRQEGCFDE